MSQHRCFVIAALLASSLTVCHVSSVVAQQLADPNFNAAVAHPAYTKNHPRIAIDEAHKNIHTAAGNFKPFADLARNDGYDVISNAGPFTLDRLQGTDVLVIANALGKLENDNNSSTPAFTPEECDTVYQWVARGGALFLIADHGPLGDAAAPLAQRFGVTLGNGFVFDTNPGNFGDRDPTELVFSEGNHLLGKHPIIRGRDAAERLRKLVAFTGESVTIPPGATAILQLSPTTGEAPTRSASQPLYNDDPATAQANRESALAKWPVRNRAMAIAFPLGRGRVVISGEAGMLTAQIFIEKDSDGTEKVLGKMGMNVPGNDDRQYALNILHWLSGSLK